MSTADDVDADLLVLGSRGRGPIGSMLLGSVSADELIRARQSVLVANAPGSRALCYLRAGGLGNDLVFCVGLRGKLLCQLDGFRR
jgi:hypothetical protein